MSLAVTLARPPIHWPAKQKTTPNPDPAHTLRAIYLVSLHDIHRQRIEERSATRDIYRGLLENLVTTFTQAGQSDDLVAIGREIAALAALADASPASASASKSSDKGGNGNNKVGANSIERLIPLPEDIPPTDDDAFAKISLPESMTVTVGSYRLRDAISIAWPPQG